MQRSDGRFEDRSLLSGADSIADGRVVGLLDFNRDGLTDLALVNANAPRFQLFRNETKTESGVVALRLQGGQRAGPPEPGWSNRDAIGARVRVQVGDLKLYRHLQAGEGFAAQNSRTLLIGIGSAKIADEVEVLWPSGRRTVLKSVAAGQLLTVDERTGAAGTRSADYGVHPSGDGVRPR